MDQLVETAILQVNSGIKRLKMVVGVDKGGWQEDARQKLLRYEKQLVQTLNL